MIKQDILENQVNSIYLGIGSNLGRKKKNIEKAKFELAQRNIKILQSSSFYESLSWPNPNNPRTCDIDILDYDGLNLELEANNNKLLIPHPRLHNRNFVLFPLFEIEKN